MINQFEFEEFFRDFLLESTELLESYEKNLLEVETVIKQKRFEFGDIEENLQAIFRAIHTIKGLAGMMDFFEIKTYTHQAEDVLDGVRNNKLKFNNTLIDTLFRIMDTTKKLIENIMMPNQNPLVVEDELRFLETAVTASSPDDRFEVDDELTEAEPHAPESGEEDIPESRTVSSSVKKGKKFSSNVIRVDTGRLDSLLNTVGELVIGKNRLVEVSKALLNNRQETERHAANDSFSLENTLEEDLAETVEQLTHLIVNLQESSMKLRMVPISYTFNKYKRLVRDLARQNGKEVRLEIEGETTEVDRAVIEAMEDPLLHIIRNAIDHGLETPQERLNKGKNPCGLMKLSAYQENNAIVIHVKDDGGGIDPDRVYQKALDMGIIHKQATLTKKDILNLVFLPGFSTASVITDISGRGVGMDVVKRNVLELNGMIDLESEVGRGTTLSLKLPLTLAIIRVLLVNIGDHFFSIPISNVIETRRIALSEIQYIDEQEAIMLRNSILPIIRLADVLKIHSNNDQDKTFVVIAGIGEKRIGFTVDSLVDQQDVVIKPMGDYLKDVHGFSGATILGNGGISFVLDLATIWEEEIVHVQH